MTISPHPECPGNPNCLCWELNRRDSINIERVKNLGPDSKLKLTPINREIGECKKCHGTGSVFKKQETPNPLQVPCESCCGGLIETNPKTVFVLDSLAYVEDTNQIDEHRIQLIEDVENTQHALKEAINALIEYFEND